MLLTQLNPSTERRARVGYVFAYSFRCSPTRSATLEIERWHRQRAHIEKRIKEAKNGCGQFHLPMREAAAKSRLAGRHRRREDDSVTPRPNASSRTTSSSSAAG